MAKTKTAYFCQNCGAQYAKWIGQCTSCKEWNTVVEEVVQKYLLLFVSETGIIGNFVH